MLTIELNDEYKARIIMEYQWNDTLCCASTTRVLLDIVGLLNNYVNYFGYYSLYYLFPLRCFFRTVPMIVPAKAPKDIIPTSIKYGNSPEPS